MSLDIIVRATEKKKKLFNEQTKPANKIFVQIVTTLILFYLLVSIGM